MFTIDFNRNTETGSSFSHLTISGVIRAAYDRICQDNPESPTLLITTDFSTFTFRTIGHMTELSTKYVNCQPNGTSAARAATIAS